MRLHAGALIGRAAIWKSDGFISDNEHRVLACLRSQVVHTPHLLPEKVTSNGWICFHSSQFKIRMDVHLVNGTSGSTRRRPYFPWANDLRCTRWVSSSGTSLLWTWSNEPSSVTGGLEITQDRACLARLRWTRSFMRDYK